MNCLSLAPCITFNSLLQTKHFVKLKYSYFSSFLNFQKTKQKKQQTIFKFAAYLCVVKFTKQYNHPCKQHEGHVASHGCGVKYATQQQKQQKASLWREFYTVCSSPSEHDMWIHSDGKLYILPAMFIHYDVMSSCQMGFWTFKVHWGPSEGKCIAYMLMIFTNVGITQDNDSDKSRDFEVKDDQSIHCISSFCYIFLHNSSSLVQNKGR